MSIAALILGIAALVLSFFNIVTVWFVVPIGIAGIILGVLGKKQDQARGKATGMATAGIVLSIVGLALGVILALACYLCVTSEVNEINNSMYYY